MSAKSSFVLFFMTALLSLSCKEGQRLTKVDLTPAEQVLAQAITAHGGKKYATAHYQFTFRKKQYTFKNDGAHYRYAVSYEKNKQSVEDILNNEGLTRKVNGEAVTLTEKQIAGATGGLNSVIYFATLPHKLSDPAVNISLAGTATVKGKIYDLLQVNFDEVDGGTDHDDNFLYWINQNTHLIDYLAYDYQVNGGGVRFRSAYNPRRVDGILFQDYVNYEAPVGTTLETLAQLYTEDKLKELSRIETENVVSLP